MSFPPFFQRPKGVLLRISILRMLSEEPVHGYELMKRIEQLTNGSWIPSHSLLYNTLGNLEEQGYVSTQKDYKGEVERTIYSITKKGRTYLNREMNQMVQMISTMISSFPEQPFPQISKIFIKHLEPKERKKFLLQIHNRLKVAIKEIENELAVIEGT